MTKGIASDDKVCLRLHRNASMSSLQKCCISSVSSNSISRTASPTGKWHCRSNLKTYWSISWRALFSTRNECQAMPRLTYYSAIHRKRSNYSKSASSDRQIATVCAEGEWGDARRLTVLRTQLVQSNMADISHLPRKHSSLYFLLALLARRSWANWRLRSSLLPHSVNVK